MKIIYPLFFALSYFSIFAQNVYELEVFGDLFIRDDASTQDMKEGDFSIENLSSLNHVNIFESLSLTQLPGILRLPSIIAGRGNVYRNYYDDNSTSEGIMLGLDNRFYNPYEQRKYSVIIGEKSLNGTAGNYPFLSVGKKNEIHEFASFGVMVGKLNKAYDGCGMSLVFGESNMGGVVIGKNNVAYGFAFMFGDKSSISWGYNDSYPRFTMGSNLISLQTYALEMVLGMWNIPIPNVEWYEDGYSEKAPLFAIGNGTSALSKSNAMVVMRNGNTTIYGSLAVAKRGGDLSMGNYGREEDRN